MTGVARRPVAERLRRWLIARCAPISIDGQTVQSITIDGEDVREVTMDGDVVFDGIQVPDNGDLHARYDPRNLSANDGDPISTLPDETGNGFDLTAGTAPDYKTGIINNNPVLRFDRSNDEFLDVSFSAVSQPFTIFFVFKFRNTVSNAFEILFDSGDSPNQAQFGVDENEDFYFQSGTQVADGAADTTAHIVSALYDGSNSVLRIDGSQVASGDVGSNALDGFVVGANPDSNNTAVDADTGIGLLYPQDKSGIFSDVESYLDDQYGPIL